MQAQQKQAEKPALTEEMFNAMSPCDRVLAVFDLGVNHQGHPFVPAPHQRDSVDRFGAADGHGCWDKPGTGKTLTMTLHCLLAMCEGRAKRAVILTPPAVIPNWARFLRGITMRAPNLPMKVLEYQGTPKQRENMPLWAHHFIVMSYEIFKKDYEHLTGTLLGDLGKDGLTLVCDEGHKIKNLATANYKHVKAWHLQGVQVKLATGTPVTFPLDIYAYTRIKNPGAYRNLKHFYDLHVEEEDAYEKVTRWRNLDLARANHKENATDVLLEDVSRDLPKLSVDEWAYDLEPAHLRLYRKMAEDQVVHIEQSGEEISALSESALFHKCQQIVLNLPHFTGDAAATPAGLALAEQWLDELGDEKLIIVANYQMTNDMLYQRLRPHGARIIYGPMTHAAKMRAKDEFIADPAARVLVMQPEAGGVGVDGLQHVCHSMLFLESPSVVRQYTQAVARLARTGQTKPVQVRIAVARGTVQVRGYKRLLENDELVAQVQRTPATLRQMILGG